MDIDGKKVAKTVLEQIRLEIQEHGYTPCLAFILVGVDPGSQTYLRLKEKVCGQVGILSKKIALSEMVSEKELLQTIAEYNANPHVHGILVQMPLPKHIDERKVIFAVDPKKDVDGFHPYNL